MIFLWSARNEVHIGKHHVTCAEAEDVMQNAGPGYPKRVGHDKYAVWGSTSSRRLLQVIFVYASSEDVEPDEFERLDLHERIALEEGFEAVRIIHARDLTGTEIRRMRRRKRG